MENGSLKGSKPSTQRLLAEGVRHVAPHLVVLALQIAPTLLRQKWLNAMPAARVP